MRIIPAQVPNMAPGNFRNGLFEGVEADQPADRGRLTARDDEPVEALELLGLPHLDRLHAETRERRDVLAEVPLQGENADPHASNSRVALEDVPRPERRPGGAARG